MSEAGRRMQRYSLPAVASFVSRWVNSVGKVAIPAPLGPEPIGRGPKAVRRADRLPRASDCLRTIGLGTEQPGKRVEFVRQLLVLVVWVALGGVPFCAMQPAAAEEVGSVYETQVKPILRERCFACHGALKQEAGLRLDTLTAMLRGGESGPVISRETPASSPILERITATDVEQRMPPEGLPLTASQVGAIRSWLLAGAEGPADEAPEDDPREHWSFRPLVRPPVPANDSAWIRNPIDVFLAVAHERHGLTPQPEASRLLLVRRLYLDLLGAPPSADELAAALNDQNELWYENLVQHLLNDPRHGERWARNWMDVWRYSDWYGLGSQLRNSQKHIWHWRDWIIESLNQDLPYDEMVRQMLAADELYPNDLQKLRATGFLARNWFLFNRAQWMDETVEHVSKGFLGLTMNCSRCHDHKYDPLEQVDYYRLRAFFEPYHVRMDQVPGELDLEKNGIPRVYDGHLEMPTYVYIRGDENRPDKSRVIEPGVPAVLAFRPLEIQTVNLPKEAWQPERRPWVLDTHIAAAKQRLDAAVTQRKQAEQQLVAAEQTAQKLRAEAANAPQPVPGEPAASEPIVADRFETLDSQRWQTLGGQWVHSPGRLEQKLDGPTRSTLRLKSEPPQDFDAILRFTILGGSQYRSVGISFDATQADPTTQAQAEDTEQNVYVSAYGGGAKVQASFARGGQWQYPDAGRAARPIEVGRPYTLRLQVRGALINASLDGEPVIAWQTPLARKAGHLQLITFDALAVFQEFRLEKLAPTVKLIQPATSTEKPLSLEAAVAAVAEARAKLQVAQSAERVAQAEQVSVERRAQAARAAWSVEALTATASEPDPAQAAASAAAPPATDPATDPATCAADSPQTEATRAAEAARIEAITAERKLAVAQAEHGQAVAELGRLQAQAAGKKEGLEAAEKTLQTAIETLKKANAAVDSPVGPQAQFAPFRGAAWTPTRFFSSGKDDPTVTFVPQSTGRRTALARWITDPANPLTPRVAVNQLWMRHMGEPLVATVFDFGRKGARPSHPELLDWLAAEFVEHGWSMKHLHYLITTSAAYRMSSSLAGAENQQAQDPENRLWWRRVPIRLESQVVRDSLLTLAGTLDTTQGGPSIPPGQQASSNRRSLYFFHSNNERNLFLTMFDEALVTDCYRREQSIVPQQALALSNSQLVLTAAPQIAKRVTDRLADPTDRQAFITAAFELVLGFQPSTAEQQAALTALEAWQKQPNTDESIARAQLVWALINHNDFVTLR